MGIKALIIADALRDIHPGSDTSLYIARELQARKIECYWATSADLYWNDHALCVDGSSVNALEPKALPVLGEARAMKLREFKTVFVRKNPPVEGDYVRMCWLLQSAEEEIQIINRPSALLRFHEKMISLQLIGEGWLAPEDVMSTCIPASEKQAVDYVQNLKAKEIVIKPWLGFGGNEVKKIARESFLKSPADFLSKNEYSVIQPFEPAVTSVGDRRVFFFGGKYAGSFVRMPKPGGFVSNLAQGGSAQKQEPSAEEMKVIRKLEKWLQKVKIDFAGADLIGSQVNEVNITSPTGLSAYEMLYGQNLSKNLLDSIL